MEKNERDYVESRKVCCRDLKRFEMMDCKSMTTPMTTNLKLLGDTSETVDATLYRQMIGSLMYLTNTRPDICFAVNTLSQYMVDLRHVHLIAVFQNVLFYFIFSKGTGPTLLLKIFTEYFLSKEEK